MSQSIEEFLAQLNGTVEALSLAYGGLVATHPDPSKPIALLNSMLEAVKSQEGSSATSPVQDAYKAGTIAAIGRLATTAKLAQDIRAMSEAGPRQ